MSRWFRMYDCLLDDPKVQRLPADLFRAWVNILCIASRNAGALPPVDDIAFALRKTVEQTVDALSSLSEAGLLDEDDAGSRPHNWDKRQHKGDVSTERVKAFRKREMKRDETVSGNGNETVPRARATDTDTDKSTWANAHAAGAAQPDDPSIADRDYFRRGREVLGDKAGSMLAELKRSKGGNIALARSALEAASQTTRPREYLSAIILRPNGRPNVQAPRPSPVHAAIAQIDDAAHARAANPFDNPIRDTARSPPARLLSNR